MRSIWFATVLTGALACATDAPGTPDKTADDQGSTARDAGRPQSRKDGGANASSTGSTGSTGKPTNGAAEPSSTACETISVTARASTPEVLIVLDRSTSMTSGNRWAPSVSAIKGFTTRLTDVMQFGLMLYPAPGPAGASGIPGVPTQIPGLPGGIPGLPGGSLTIDPSACGAGMLNIPFAAGNAAAIGAALDMSPPGVASATPTAATLAQALAVLDPQECADCVAKPQYVVLVTDGQPTCGSNGSVATDPEDIAETLLALDALRERGVKTFVVGYGTAADQNLASVMNDFAKHGGTQLQHPAEDEPSLIAELTSIAGDLVTCEFELQDEVPNGDATFVRVTIDGIDYQLGEDWELRGKTIVLHDTGRACPVLRDAKLHALRITAECEPVFVQ
jgi:Mg-chelatase subunit ChlD